VICLGAGEAEGESGVCWHHSQTTRDVDGEQTGKIALSSSRLEATSLS